MMGKGKILIIGAGKVGTSLAILLDKAGYTIEGIVSGTQESASRLGKLMGCSFSTDLLTDLNVDFVIVSVPDHLLKEVLGELTSYDSSTTVIHTAGSYSIEMFPGNTSYRKGIIYPLQTFTHDRRAYLDDIPLFIEADSDETLGLIHNLASDISDQVVHIEYDQRQKLHLAAVFVCNFVNHMYFAGEKILEDTGIRFGVLEPLIRETFLKAIELGPEQSQTGPAIRNDKITLEKHLKLLSFSPEFWKIYSEITDSIMKNYSRKI